MVSNSILSEISKRLAELSPEAERIKTQLNTKVEEILKSAFSEFGILTQEDFAAQAQALKRAENRIEELEDLLNELERRINKLS